MIYPFIYTSTRYFDFRIVTSQMLRSIPDSSKRLFTEVACAMINADNTQLVRPSWTLVKKDGYILWGMATLNNVLGEKCVDDDKRPVRGFFGFITDNQIHKLPYGVPYFKELYETYVLPIWDSYEQTEQVTVNMPTISGFDFIEKSSRLNNEINIDNSICRIFPSTSESKSLIEAVFASSGDYSIATNIHGKKQCVEFGKDKISFTNAVMSFDSKFNRFEDIKVFVHKEVPVNTRDTPIETNNDITDESFCSICEKPISGYEGMCKDCKNKQQNKKNLKYGLYGFMVLICLIFLEKGPGIWEKFLSPKHVKEVSLFLSTNKKYISVYDATTKDVFTIKYESSSTIKVTSPDNWIRIITPSWQFSKEGIIEFVCDSLSHGRREGVICISNFEGVKVNIPVRQTSSGIFEDVVNGTEAVYNSGKKASDIKSCDS